MIVPAEPARLVGPREITLRLRDGSVLSGDLAVEAITVETAFGRLTVPIEKIIRFRPGLESYPDLSARLADLVEKLGDEDFGVRDAAQKELIAWGRPIRRQLDDFADDENAERKRRVQEVTAAIDELSDSLDDEFEEEEEPSLSRNDLVETSEFSISGKIVEDSFQLSSKYGELTVKLNDVAEGDRPHGSRPSYTKRVVVEGTNVAGMSFKSTGIRLNRGDKVSMRADGQLVMTPWGPEYTVTPDGNATYDWYLPGKIAGGALVGRIGSGEVFKVGSRVEFVARRSGTLQLAVGISPDWVGEGYSYPGRYNVRVRVDPK